eukprot:scaffold1239_cov175-Pinguiococcus_pyrenoidosus.AAC.7
MCALCKDAGVLSWSRTHCLARPEKSCEDEPGKLSMVAREGPNVLSIKNRATRFSADGIHVAVEVQEERRHRLPVVPIVGSCGRSIHPVLALASDTREGVEGTTAAGRQADGPRAHRGRLSIHHRCRNRSVAGAVAALAAVKQDVPTGKARKHDDDADDDDEERGAPQAADEILLASLPGGSEALAGRLAGAQLGIVRSAKGRPGRPRSHHDASVRGEPICRGGRLCVCERERKRERERALHEAGTHAYWGASGNWTNRRTKGFEGVKGCGYDNPGLVWADQGNRVDLCPLAEKCQSILPSSTIGASLSWLIVLHQLSVTHFDHRLMSKTLHGTPLAHQLGILPAVCADMVARS